MLGVLSKILREARRDMRLVPSGCVLRVSRPAPIEQPSARRRLSESVIEPSELRSRFRGRAFSWEQESFCISD